MSQSANAYNEAWLLLFIAKLTGIFPISSRAPKWANRLYTVLVLIVYYALFAWLNPYTQTAFKFLDHVSPTTKLRKLRYNLNVILLPLTLFSAMHTSPQLRGVYREIRNVDEGIKYLNSRVDYKFDTRHDVVFTLSVIVVTLIFNLCDYFGLKDGTKGWKLVLMWILDRFPDFVNNVVMCSFAVTVRKINVRLNVVSRIVRWITKEKNPIAISESVDRNHGFTKGSGFRLKLAGLLNAQLRRTWTLALTAFEFQLMILSTVYIVFLCFHFTVIYTYMDSLQQMADVLLSFLWGTFDVGRFVYLMHLYRLVAIQAI